MVVSKRIKYLRKTLALSQTEFGKRLGVSKSVILNVELEKVIPKDILIEHICEIFYVNNDWLVDGIGDMFKPDAQPNKELDEFLNHFFKLDPDYRKVVMQQAYILLEVQNKKMAEGSIQ